VRAEVGDWLEQAAGRSRCPRVWLDPGIGFAKTAAQSLSLMKGLPELVARGWPVLVGASRKSFIGAALGLGSPEERLHGSLGAAAWAARAGVGALRVHDVRATRELLDMMAAIQGAA
jgi:dihydropteroate synthase